MPAGPPGQLAHGRLAALQHGGDVRVGVAEGLSEHEHGPLQRRQRLQDDEDGQGDGVGEHGPLGGVRDGVPEVGHVRLGQPGPDVRLVARLDLAQPVDGEAGGDAHQIAARFPHLGAVGAGPAQPRLLDDVLRVGHPPEHAVGDAHQDGAVVFEDVGSGVRGHGTIPCDASGHVQEKSMCPGAEWPAGRRGSAAGVAEVAMRYGVLGTGEVGRTLGGKLAELGHEVTLGSRSKDNPTALEWARGAGAGAQAGTFAEAASSAEVVVVAVGGRVALTALEAAGAENLDGKVVVDVSNPMAFEDGELRLSPVESDSVGEQIQRAFPHARVVKTLNTVNSKVMVDPSLVPGEHQIFVCGTDASAKEQVIGLLGEFGWPPHRVLDLGGIRSARSVEMLLPLWLDLFRNLGHAEFNIEVRRGH